MTKIIRKLQWQDWVNCQQRKDILQSLYSCFNVSYSRSIHHENQQTLQQIKANYTQMPLANSTASALPAADPNLGAK